MKFKRECWRLANVVLLLAAARPAGAAPYTDLTPALGQWGGDASVWDLDFNSSTGTWGFSGGQRGRPPYDGVFLTTQDFVSFTQRAANITSQSLQARTDGNVWVLGRSSGSVMTSTDLVNFSDRSSALGFSYLDLRTDGTTWVFGGASGQLKTTTNFVTFSDFTTALGYGSYVYIWTDGTTWLFADWYDRNLFKTTTDFVSFTDRLSDLNLAEDPEEWIQDIAQSGGTWAIHLGANHWPWQRFKTTTDFVTYTQHSFYCECDWIDRVAANASTWVFMGYARDTDIVTTTDFVNFTQHATVPGSYWGIHWNGSVWALGGTDGGLLTTADFQTYSDFHRAASFGSDAYAVETDGTTWAVGGSSGELRTTRNLWDFSDRTAALDLENLYSIRTSGGIWALGGGASWSGPYLKTTTNFVDFSDRSSSAGLGSGMSVSAIEAGDRWVLGANGYGRLRSTSDFVTFSDHTTALNWGGYYWDGIYAIRYSSPVYAIGGDGGKLKTTTDLLNYSDRKTALGFGSDDVLAIDAGSVTGGSSTSDLTPAGTGSGSFSSADAGRVSDDSYATTGTAGATQEYITFNFPSDSSAVNGLEVKVEGKFSITATSTAATNPGQAAGSWTNVGNARLSDDNRATATTNTATFESFGFAVPSYAVIKGIAVSVEGQKSGGQAGHTIRADVKVTVPGNTAGCNGSFSSAKSTSNFPAGPSDTTYTVGGSTDLWGQTGWTGSSFDNGNFCVQVTAVRSGSPSLLVDAIAVTVTYLDSQPKFRVDLWNQTAGRWSQTSDTGTLTETDQTFTLGSSSALWGETWTNSDLTNANFRLRVTSVLGAGGTPTWSLDSVSAKLYRQAPALTWAIGGGDDTAVLKTTTDFVNFSTRSAGFSGPIGAIRYNSGTWYLGGPAGEFKTTTDFVNFSDRTTDLGMYRTFSRVRSIAVDNGVELVAGRGHRVMTNLTSPLAVTLVNFEAHGYDGEVWVYWETGTEIYNAGFNLYRARAGEGRWTLLTPEPIRGLNTSVAGGKYLYRDFGVENGVRYYYYLEDIDYFVGGTLHGPVEAVPSVSAGPARELTAAEERTYAAIVHSNEAGAFPPAGSGVGPDGSGPYAGGMVQWPQASVVLSGAAESIVEIAIPAGEWVTEETGRYFDIPGMSRLGLSGKPVIPYRGLLIEAPCRQRAEWEVTAMGEETFSGVLPVAEVGTLPNSAGWQEGDDPNPASALWGEGETGGEGGTYPAAYAVLGEVRCLSPERGHLTVGLTPARYDASAQTVVQARGLRIRLRWGDPPAAESYNPPAALAELAADGGSLKVGIGKSGIYRIGAWELAPFWPSVGSYLRSHVRLYRKGEVVPYRWIGSPEGRVGEGELEFYADHRDSRHAKESVYWLAYRPEDPWSGGEDNSAGSSLDDAVLLETTRAESNSMYVPSIAGSKSLDRFMWASSAYSHTPFFEVSPTVRFALPAAGNSRPVKLKYAIQTGTADRHREPSHHLRAYVNGELVDDFLVSGITPLVRSVALSVSQLRAGTNTFQLREAGDRTTYLVRTYLNWIEVTAERSGIWNGEGELSVQAVSNGTARLSGLPAQAEVSVWDRTNPGRAKRFATLFSDGSGELRFPVQGGRLYALRRTPQRVGWIRPNGASRLRSLRATPALYLTHADFRAAAERLAAHRSRDRAVTVIDVEDVYDEFDGGDKSAEAIGRFVREWKQRAGRSLSILLIGDASVDPNNYLGSSAADFVPTDLIFRGTFETGSDPSLIHGRWGWRVGDRIGRLPVTTAAEAETVVEKIIGFEAAPPESAWLRKIALYADKPANNAERVFSTFTRELAGSIPAPFEVEVGLQEELAAEEVRARIRNSFNDGTWLINYLGHGAYNFWGRNQVFKSADLAALFNRDRPSIVTALNCLNGYFVHQSNDPAFRSLAETALAYPWGGAAAYLSASGLNTAGALQYFGGEFYRRLTQGNAATLGEVVAAVLQRLPEAEEMEALSDTLHLLGDPDMKIPGISPVTEGPAAEAGPGAAGGAEAEVDLSLTENGPRKVEFAVRSPAERASAAEEPKRGCATSGAALMLLAALALLVRRTEPERRVFAAAGRKRP